jgi:hypothetical protein
VSAALAVPLPAVPSWLAQAPSEPAPSVAPDPDQAERFARFLFSGLEGCGGFVHFRAIEEPPPSGRKPAIDERWEPIDAALPRAFGDYVVECAKRGLAAFAIPAIMEYGKGGRDGLIASVALVVDIDTGDVAQKLARLAESLGTPSLVLLSGGTVKENGQSKAHVYYRLTEPVPGDQSEGLESLRRRVAVWLKADEKVGRNLVQILRVPGSVHRKDHTAPSACRIVSEDPAARHELAALVRAFGSVGADAPTAPNSNILDFNSVKPRATTADDLRDGWIETEGKSGVTRWDAFTSVAGKEIADAWAGRKSIEEAQSYMHGWVQSRVERPEDWSAERIDREFDGILRRHIQNHGPLPPATPAPAVLPVAASDGWSIKAWRIDRFAEPAPERRWLVDGLIPAGTAGMLAAVGDAGKSMLALNLALAIGAAPQPTWCSVTGRWLGAADFFGCPVVGRGAVVMLTAEDDKDEVHRRVQTLDASGRRRNNPPVYVVPMQSTGGPRTLLTAGRSGPEPTPFWHTLRGQLLEIAGEPGGLALVVIDPLSIFGGVNLDNDNQAGALLMALFGMLATETGATVMAVHHFSKTMTPESLGEARKAIRGASALVDNARWAVAVWEPAEKVANGVLAALDRRTKVKQEGLVYQGGLVKGNAPGAKIIRTLVRDPATGLLVDRTDAIRAAAPKREDLDATVLAALLAELMENERLAFGISRRGAWGVLEPVMLRRKVEINENQLGECLRRLMEKGHLVEVERRGGHPVFAPKVA